MALVSKILLLCVFFLMPLSLKLAPIFIFFWFISLLISYFSLKEKSLSSDFSFLKDLTDIRLAMIVYWLIALLSGFFVEDRSLMFSRLEIKLSFFLVPMAFSLSYLNVNWIKRMLLAFLAGNLAAFFWNTGDAVKSYLANEKVSEFIMSQYSELVHSSYWSMYLVFSLMIIGYFILWKTYNGQTDRILWGILTLIFLVGIMLVQSKNAILALFFIPFMMIIWFVVRKGRWKRGLAVLISITLLVGLSFYLTPNLQSRFSKMHSSFSNTNINSESNSSTDLRLIAWNASLKLIKEKPLKGHGLGQEKNRLVEIYKKDNFKKAEQLRLDSHSQFLYSWISSGILGFLSLLYLFILLIYQGYKRKNGLLILFSILVFFSCLTESMFETQSGVLFFVFFALLLSKMPVGRKQNS